MLEEVGEDSKVWKGERGGEGIVINKIGNKCFGFRLKGRKGGILIVGFSGNRGIRGGGMIGKSKNVVK